jgi:ABC-type bacteriocin/lantibiotic exporter with double-glycine peptidase domain
VLTPASGAADLPRLPLGFSVPMPGELWLYIRHACLRDQIWLSVLTVAVFLLTMVPLELQRRVVNDAIGSRDLQAILLLCLTYVAVVLVQGGLKLWLNIYRARVSEAATRHLRLLVQKLCDDQEREPAEGGPHDGVKISVAVAEVDPVGGFIGLSVSEPLLHGGILLSVFGYMLFLQPMMALVCLGVFVPQIVFVPLMQREINRRTKSRIKVLRKVSVGLVESANGEPDSAPSELCDDTADIYQRRTDRIYELDMRIFKLKFTMNFLMNSLQHLAVAAILFVGGWFVVQGRTEVGTVVAFISGLDRVNDPWGDLVNYFREMSTARVKYRMVAKALDTGLEAEALTRSA